MNTQTEDMARGLGERKFLLMGDRVAISNGQLGTVTGRNLHNQWAVTMDAGYMQTAPRDWFTLANTDRRAN